MENKKEKDWFEANYLDGDKIQDGQILSSKECFDALKNYKHKLLQSIVEMIEETRKEKRADWGRETSYEMENKNGFNEALDSLKSKLLDITKEK